MLDSVKGPVFRGFLRSMDQKHFSFELLYRAIESAIITRVMGE